MSSMGEEKMDSKATANINDASSMNEKQEQKQDKNNGNPSQNIQKKKRKPRKPPAVAWKKPKGMPKRPLSAYNLFFKVQRGAIMSARAKDKSEAALKRSKKETVGIGFANLARTIADKWQSLDDTDKAQYLEQAAKEKARYKEEMVVWRKKQKEEKERQANMPPVSVTGIPPSQQAMTMGGMIDSRIHPALWQGSLLHQQTNGLLFGMQPPQPYEQAPMVQSYLQELTDSTLLQRQQQQLQELQARQLLLAGALDPSSPPPRPPQNNNNGPVVDAASYPDTWFELPSSQQQQQPKQPQALQREMNQQSAPSFGDDGELRKLNPGGKSFGWQQSQLLQDQHLQQLQGGGDPQGMGVSMLKQHGDMKKLSSSSSSNALPENQLLKQAPEASPTMGRGASNALGVANGGGTSNRQSLYNLASKLDNDTISFLTEFRFNGNNSSSSSEGSNNNAPKRS